MYYFLLGAFVEADKPLNRCVEEAALGFNGKELLK